jgi:integrase/recombinase XerD
MIAIQKAIDPQTGERYSCVFDCRTCLPVEPIQRYINYCRRRQLAANTVFTYTCRLVDFWHWVDVQDLDSRGRIRIVRRGDNPNGATAKGREREIPILHNRQEVQSTFAAYLLEEYPTQAEKLAHGMLLVNLDKKYAGKPMTSARLNQLFHQLSKRTGIEAHPHLFRHTFATRMLQAGYLDEYVQQLLGHKSIATTKDIYSHVLDEMSLDTYLLGVKNEDEE